MVKATQHPRIEAPDFNVADYLPFMWPKGTTEPPKDKRISAFFFMTGQVVDVVATVSLKGEDPNEEPNLDHIPDEVDWAYSKRNVLFEELDEWEIPSMSWIEHKDLLELVKNYPDPEKHKYFTYGVTSADCMSIETQEPPEGDNILIARFFENDEADDPAEVGQYLRYINWQKAPDYIRNTFTHWITVEDAEVQSDIWYANNPID